MLVKLLVIGLLVFMVFNLYRAMRVMLRGDAEGQSMTKFIGRRVLTSAVIILILIIAVALGWIQPNPRPY
ncbi:DUF2909 domain-containing protein [Bowmanella dokdonensis]|uniref:DUF2909 domain-containing protein n=1 Tax=Bowmanella dokdonensis TaxID=751969 RepID=A0A939DJH1_9ALTE|nr:DUF2909 domain-containing protein [Bowmanella dokdonensis]MBN7823613.1 DUF2909 domain-containing protein [Bowmanella dokdonensis]